MIAEYNNYQTLPLQIRSWINNPSPDVSCQMPTIFLKLILDKGQIPSHMRVRTDAAHPFLMVEGNGKYFAMDYYDRGGRVREIDKDSWENRLTFRDQAFLNDSLSAMRFLDYGNVFIELVELLDSSGHDSTGQVENMNLISELSDQMKNEFGDTEELSGYFEMTRKVHRSVK